MAGQDETKHNEDEVAPENDVDITDPEQDNDENMSEEYYLLDTKLDELNTALDFLEKRTDDIHEKLKELLQSNKSIREELRNENLKSIEKWFIIITKVRRTKAEDKRSNEKSDGGSESYYD